METQVWDSMRILISIKEDLKSTLIRVVPRDLEGLANPVVLSSALAVSAMLPKYQVQRLQECSQRSQSLTT